MHAFLRLLVLLVFVLGANSPVGAESLQLIDYELQDQFEQARGIKPRFPVLDLDYAGTAALEKTFTNGHCDLANIQYHPLPNLMGGAELQWLKRDNFDDGFSYDS